MKKIKKVLPDTLMFLVVAYVGSIDFKASCLLVAGLCISAIVSQETKKSNCIKKELTSSEHEVSQ